jgi:hypothetical protein
VSAISDDDTTYFVNYQEKLYTLSKGNEMEKDLSLTTTQDINKDL